MTDGQTESRESISASGSHKIGEPVLVRWQDDDGDRREGVLCAVVAADPIDDENGDRAFAVESRHMIELFRMSGEVRSYRWWNENGRAAIWDFHRNERCLITLGRVQLVEPRCPRCNGEGVVPCMFSTSLAGSPAWKGKMACPACSCTSKSSR